MHPRWYITLSLATGNLQDASYALILLVADESQEPVEVRSTE